MSRRNTRGEMNEIIRREVEFPEVRRRIELTAEAELTLTT